MNDFRQDLRQRLESMSAPDVLIVGGGINGCGLFRELALQKVDTLLVTRDDFSMGASAAPSRMVHGGLRYLEQAEFRLVKESLAERNRLLENAPHYVKPLPTNIPVYHWFAGLGTALKKFCGFSDKPGRRGAIWVKIGLSFYDFYTRGKRMMPRHSFVSRRKALAKLPQIDGKIACFATYYDAWVTYPERLCHELVVDGRAACQGAAAFNYIELVGIEGGEAVLKCGVTDQEFRVRPKILVNATGAWIDEANQLLNRKTEYIGGTKGSHLVIDHPELCEALDSEMILYENPDGRVCLVFPFHGKVLVGSTDIPVEKGDDGVCDEREVDYMLESLSRVLPGFRVDRSHIVFRFCGVRPLPRSDAVTAGQVSRDHSCKVDEPTSDRPFPIYSLVGGKWTTFRAFSEQVADRSLQYLNKDRLVSSQALPIGGGKGLPREPQRLSNWIGQQAQLRDLPESRTSDLVARYGSRTMEVAAYLKREPDEDLDPKSGYTIRELRFLIETEDVVHLEDLLLRRTSLALLGMLTPETVERSASICSEVLGWDADRRENEIDRFRLTMRRIHGTDLK